MPELRSSSEANKLATWALVSSIVGLCCCGIVLGPLGIVLGVKAKNDGAEGGTATAAIVIGIIAVVLTIVGMILQFTVGIFGQGGPFGHGGF